MTKMEIVAITRPSMDAVKAKTMLRKFLSTLMNSSLMILKRATQAKVTQKMRKMKAPTTREAHPAEKATRSQVASAYRTMIRVATRRARAKVTLE